MIYRFALAQVTCSLHVNVLLSNSKQSTTSLSLLVGTTVHYNKWMDAYILTLCIIGSFSFFLWSADFSPNYIFRKKIWSITRVYSSLEDQARHYVWLDVVPKLFVKAICRRHYTDGLLKRYTRVAALIYV